MYITTGMFLAVYAQVHHKHLTQYFWSGCEVYLKNLHGPNIYERNSE